MVAFYSNDLSLKPNKYYSSCDKTYRKDDNKTKKILVLSHF